MLKYSMFNSGDQPPNNRSQLGRISPIIGGSQVGNPKNGQQYQDLQVNVAIV